MRQRVLGGLLVALLAAPLFGCDGAGTAFLDSVVAEVQRRPPPDTPPPDNGHVDVAQAAAAFRTGSFCERDHWCWYNPRPAGTWWMAAGGTSRDDLWIGGMGETLLHFDGRALTSASPGLSITEGLWATSKHDVWAVGIVDAGKGGIAHGDGTTFTTSYVNNGGEFMDIWAASPNDIYVVSYAGAVHWDGAAWSPIQGVEGLTVSGSGPRDVWISASDGLWHFDGQAWSRAPALQGKYVIGVTVPARNDVWAAALHDGVTDLMHFDGATWTVTYTVAANARTTIWGIGSGGRNDVWAHGVHYSPLPESQQGGFLLRWDGHAWTQAPLAPASIWRMRSVGGVDYAMGQGGQILRLAAGVTPAWTEITAGSFEALAGTWGSSPQDMWAVGDHGTSLHFDGTAVRPVPTSSTVMLDDVWGTGPRDAWAVGRSGTALHWDGETWTAAPTGSTAELFAVFTGAADDVWIGGDGPTLLHGDGMSFAPAVIDGLAPGAQILDIHGVASDDLWAVGYSAPGGGFVSHFDGTAWSPAEFITANAGGFPAIRVWAIASNDVWALAQGGFRGNNNYFHFDGTTWTGRFMPPSPETWMFPSPGLQSGGALSLGSFGFSRDDVWSVGQFGAWIRRTP